MPHPPPLQHGAAGQNLPVWTPGPPEEVGVGVAEGPQALGPGPGGWVPQPDAPTPPARGEQASIGTPRHAVHCPCMAAQHTRRLAALHLPEADLGIGTDTGELFAIRTPVKIIEGGRVSLDDPHTLPPLNDLDWSPD